MNKKFRVEVYSKREKYDEPFLVFYVTSLEQVVISNFDYFFLVSEVRDDKN